MQPLQHRLHQSLECGWNWGQSEGKSLPLPETTSGCKDGLFLCFWIQRQLPIFTSQVRGTKESTSGQNVQTLVYPRNVARILLGDGVQLAVVNTEPPSPSFLRTIATGELHAPLAGFISPFSSNYCTRQLASTSFWGSSLWGGGVIGLAPAIWAY